MRTSPPVGADGASVSSDPLPARSRPTSSSLDRPAARDSNTWIELAPQGVVLGPAVCDSLDGVTLAIHARSWASLASAKDVLE